MKRIYICSPYRGDVAGNTKRALTVCRRVALQGMTPIAPHLYCTRYLDDNIDQERHTGLTIGLDLLRLCDELWYYGDTVSEGMQGELKEARRLNIPIVHKDF
jgi:dienelactone hydrolase